ncbi:N-6 DNA methylase [archaeon]|nr:N-6 DNA methylase [Nanoarchaeota archaeon]MCG2724334.1 N-6 DNA methylase [archaeon]
MLDSETKRRIDTARDILVGKIPDPKSQIEQITVALIYKFMDDMDKKSEELGGKSKFFTGAYAKYAWNKILDRSVSGFELVALYGESIQSMNQNPNLPQLFRDIFKNAYLPYRDPETLRAFLRIIDDFTYDHSERLGDAFEYLLSVMGSQGDAGQFRTPRHIIDFIVKVVDPSKKDTILDPACGTAGFLISAYKHILEKNMKDGKLELTPDERKKLVENIVGYDISPDMVRLSLVNLYLHGFKNPHIYEYDALTSDEKWNETFDVALANPPFMTPKGGIRPHKRFSVDSNRAEVLFVDYMAEHLTNDGKAGIVVPEGIIFQSGSTYKQLRKMLVDNALYAVVSLPAGVFNPYSGVKTSVLFLDKRIVKKSKDILFVKAESDGFGLGAQRREIKNNDLTEALEILQKYQKAILEGVEPEIQSKIAHIVSKKVIGKTGEYNLSGDRYKETVVYDGKWDLVELGDVAETSSGGTPLKSKTEYYENGIIPWVKSGEVAQGLIYKAEENITELGLKNSSAKIFPINTVLVAMYGATVGQVGILKFEAATNQAICGILPNNKFIPEFLFSILKSRKAYLISLSGGGAQPNISQKIIRELNIPLPPLEVQERIVEELESYQNIIDGAKKVVESYKPSFKIEKEWEIKSLDEVCIKINDGTHLTPKYMDSGVPFWRVTDLTNSNDSKKFICKEEHQELIKRCKPEKGDILYSKNGTIGVAKLIDWNWEFSIFVSLALLKPKRDILNSNYLEIFLNSPNAFKQATAHSKSGTVTNLHLIEIKQMIIPLPPLEIQKQIVARIEEEQKLVDANKKLIELFEKKIKDKIAEVWGG